jgi:hypothetical protein
VKSAFLCTAALLLAACYASTGRHGNLDGGEEASPDDGREDGAVDVAPEGYAFVDRDTPDRNIPVRLLFAELPSIAWDGVGTTGLVYTGIVEGEPDNTIGFMPLDAFGNVTGDERIVLDTPGLWGSIPKLSGDEEGFLLCTLDESSYDSIVVLHLSAIGEVLARGATPAMSNIVSPVSGPVRLADHVFVATTSFEDYETTVLYRFAYPSLSYESELATGGDADWPILRKTPGADTLLLFYKVPSGALMADEISPGLDVLRTFQVPREETFVDYSAAAGSREWYAWFASMDYDDRQFFLETVSAGGFSSSSDHPADFYGSFMSSTASDVPSFGAVFSLFDRARGIWDVRARLDALPQPDYLLDADLIVNDIVEDRTMDDGIHADIAWTDGGFLVVWDEWRAPYNYTLFSSFIALEAVP